MSLLQDKSYNNNVLLGATQASTWTVCAPPATSELCGGMKVYRYR